MLDCWVVSLSDLVTVSVALDKLIWDRTVIDCFERQWVCFVLFLSINCDVERVTWCLVLGRSLLLTTLKQAVLRPVAPKEQECTTGLLALDLG